MGKKTYQKKKKIKNLNEKFPCKPRSRRASIYIGKLFQNTLKNEVYISCDYC